MDFFDNSAYLTSIVFSRAKAGFSPAKIIYVA